MNRRTAYALCLMALSAACALAASPGGVPSPARGSRLPDLRVQLSAAETARLFPERRPNSGWAGAIPLAEGRRARMLRTCFGDSVVVGITFADAVPPGGVVELKLGPEMDSPAASAEWVLHPYLVTTRDSSALDLLDRIAAEAPDTVAAWVVDTANLARSYGMEVRAVRACG